ncbi:MAG TPA: NADP-dependent oxidoreductase [Pseudonocardia sp.]|nr:NADP-dependent oxidoreductase [Pseudonocardia sp.]
MKAVRYHGYGAPDVLRVDEADRPTPGPGQVVLRVAGTSFNGVDAGIRGGYLQPVFPVTLPHVPGVDVAGTVTEVGAGVTGLRVGDAVIGMLPMTAPGATAEFVAAPAELLTAAPTTVPLADAAALPAVGLTAWQALTEHADLGPGQRVLINGAGGAVGGYAVQLAARAGATVLATASPRSSEVVRAHGAHEVVLHTATPLTEAVTEPVDVLLNLVAGLPEQGAALLGLVRPGGSFLNLTPPAPAAVPGVRVAEVYVRSDAGQLAQLVALVDAGELRIDVAARRPFGELAAVHAESDAGTLRGKVVLVPEP